MNGKEEAQKCEQCEFKTTSKALLNKHKEAVHKSSLEQHTQEMRKRQKCEQCDFKTTSPAVLKRHTDSHHEARNIKQSGRKVCTLCNKRFNKESTYMCHMKKVHNEGK